MDSNPIIISWDEFEAKYRPVIAEGQSINGQPTFMITDPDSMMDEIREAEAANKLWTIYDNVSGVSLIKCGRRYLGYGLVITEVGDDDGNVGVKWDVHDWGETMCPECLNEDGLEVETLHLIHTQTIDKLHVVEMGCDCDYKVTKTFSVDTLEEVATDKE